MSHAPARSAWTANWKALVPEAGVFDISRRRGPLPYICQYGGPLIRPPMSCATAIEETVLHAVVAGTLSKMTVPVGIEVGSVAIEALGVMAI